MRRRAPRSAAPSLALARGLALYNSRRDYVRAAELLTAAAKDGAPDPAKASFYAARAYARANDDDRAIRLYAELGRTYPKSSWAESASYLTGKTYYAGSRFPEAIQAYDRYLARFGKNARYGKEAGAERATALLAAGRYAEAAKALFNLRGSARDSREKSRLLELEGAARAGAGEREAAVKLFQAAIDEQPLSFAALVARARLERLGESCPPLLGGALSEPNPVPTPVIPELPKAVALLNELGLDREAEAELSRASTRSRAATRGAATRPQPRLRQARLRRPALPDRAERGERGGAQERAVSFHALAVGLRLPAPARARGA